VSVQVGDGDVHPTLPDVAAVQLVGQVGLEQNAAIAQPDRRHAQRSPVVLDPLVHEQTERTLKKLHDTLEVSTSVSEE
jgi:hypothetical protein